MEDDPRYEVKDEQVQMLLRGLSLKLAESMKDMPGWGFTLFLYSFVGTEPNAIFYMSNSVREDMLLALKEFIAKEEAKNAG